MFNEEEPTNAPRVAPPLPRALREKLFVVDDAHAKLPLFATRFSVIGAEGWPAPASLSGATGSVRWVNPLEQAVSFTLVLGVEVRLQVFFERQIAKLIPPEHRIPDSLAMRWLGRLAPLRKEYNRLFFEIGPGETLEIPAEFSQAIRHIDRGFVAGGHAHMLVIEGEEAPPIHPGLIKKPDESDERAPVKAAARRRQ